MFKKILLSFFVILFSSQICLSDDVLEVHTRLGILKGTWKSSSEGKKIIAFEGVPYAQPPVGDLRFEDPLPVKPWRGVYTAYRPRVCVQAIRTKGEEDCLCLNIYIPSETIDQEKKYNVVVVIPGAAFLVGSGTSVKPEYLMDRDIIVVTVNYRLGILGFLSSGDEVLPGNYGLKDQVRALKWVKRNIHYFGGNNETITITGLSAGGASVHLHYLSPLSKGLFVRGMSQSGNALDPWVIKRNPLEVMKRLASLVACDEMSTEEMKKCLKTRPAYLLLEKQKEFYGYDELPIAPFGPVIEQKSKNAFLTEDPYVLMKEKRILDVPWIVSTCSEEGLLAVRRYYAELDEIENDWTEFAHYFLDYNDTLPVSKREEVARTIKEFYLGPEEPINKDNFKNFAKIFTDRLFTVGAETSAKLQSKANKSPVYYYLFNHKRAEKKSFRNTDETPSDDIPQGVAHGEDSTFFYGFNLIKQPEEAVKGMLDACQNMLYSYAATGQPSFDGTDKWKPTTDSELTYLNITAVDHIELQKRVSLAPVEFWSSLGLVEQENLVVKDEL